MAANLSQVLLEETGMVPSLAQELTVGSFHEGRESFQEYIYSKLLHGEDKSSNSSEPKPGSSVFPNTDLANNYPNSLVGLGSAYIHGLDSSSHHPATTDSCSNDSNEDERSKVLNNPSPSKSLSSRKLGITKKSLSHLMHGTVQQDGVESNEGSSKIKKNSHLKKKEKSHVCDVCGRGFAEKYTLNRHMLTHTHIKPYSCSKCKMSFSRSDGLAKHMAAGHRRIDAHHCDVCGGTFNSELSFEQHRREYGTTLPFVCNLCMLAFSQCCHLNYHMKSHSLSKMNDSFSYDGKDDKNNDIDVSELIPDDFSPPKKDQFKISAQDLIDSFNKSGSKYIGTGHNTLDLLHQNITIKPEIDDFPACGGIRNQFASDSSVHKSGFVNSSFNSAKNHSVVTSAASHGAELSQSAQVDSNLTDGNSVLTPTYLPDTSKDLNLSGPSKPFAISESEMTKYYNIKIPNPKFLENSDQHVTIVADGSLFRCEVCGKGFTRKYHMQRHVKLHIRGPVPRAHLLDWTRRPYACGVCKMGFTRQHHLTRHILIHTGERPHSCHICGRAFRRYTNLSLHIRTVHGSERPFKCHVCGRGFPRLYSLQRHLKLHARNAYALNSNSDDQLYTGFKAVGTMNVDSSKSPIYSLANQSNVQQSPGNIQESLASNQHGKNEEFKESNEHLNNLEHIESGGKGSTLTNQEGYAFLQEENHISFQPRTDQRIQNTDQRIQNTDLIRRCQSGQTEDGHSQIGLPQPQVLSLPESDNRAQQNRRVSTDAEKLQNPAHSPASNDFTTLPHLSDAVRNQISLHSRNLTDFSIQQSAQNTNEQRLISLGSMSSQNLMMLNMAIGGNFSELGMTETRNYPPIQRDANVDVFPAHQQIKIPLPMMSSLLERPGSRSKINPTSCHDPYQHPSPSYSLPSSSSQIQQRSSSNLPTTRKPASPATMQEHSGYSHNSHLDIAITQSGINDPSVYSHNHLVNGLPFQVGTLGMYQQLLSESLNQIDIHPHPNASPMPVTSDNGMPY